tara:strand:- start:149 stop:418 length:270 start_codon:yes stop_codon:yes gene_type:complete
MSENKNKEVTTEEFIINLLEEEYGTVHDSIDSDIKHEKLCACVEVLAKAHTAFVKNPNAVNWRIMITAMAAYQYWAQKATLGFDLGADF